MSHEFKSNCCYRKNPPSGQPVCGYLQEFVGLSDHDSFKVNPDICQACQQWHQPTGETLNPAVASLLYQEAHKALESELTEFGKYTPPALKEIARSFIPDESDYISIEQETERQSGLEIENLDDLIPLPDQGRRGKRVTNWAVGVTTAPRKQATLQSCVDCLVEAGWDSPRIFVDGEVDLGSLPSHLEVTRRDPQVGAWPSWYLALSELLMRQPKAEAFMIVQDDVVMFRHRKLRQYMEDFLWPEEGPCVVSLFCSRAYTSGQAGWRRLDENLVWGGQALIFSREACLGLLSDPGVLGHRLTESGFAGIDSVVGSWAGRHNVPVYVSTPSLAQHIGHVSAIWSFNTKAYINRRAPKFAGSFPIQADE